jgi:hypothetical protein
MHSLSIITDYLGTPMRTPSTTPIRRPTTKSFLHYTPLPLLILLSPPPLPPLVIIRPIMIITTNVSGSSSSSSQNGNGFDDRLTIRSYLRSGWLNTNDLFTPGVLST